MCHQAGTFPFSARVLMMKGMLSNWRIHRLYSSWVTEAVRGRWWHSMPLRLPINRFTLSQGKSSQSMQYSRPFSIAHGRAGHSLSAISLAAVTAHVLGGVVLVAEIFSPPVNEFLPRSLIWGPRGTQMAPGPTISMHLRHDNAPIPVGGGVPLYKSSFRNGIFR